MTNNAYIFTERSISLFYNGKTYTISATHDAARDIRTAIIANDFETAVDLIDAAKAIAKWSNGRVTVEGNIICFDGEVLEGPLVQRVLQMKKEGFSVEPMALFIENLYSNPSMTAVKELYLFLEHGALPITDDGCFLAYKKVTEDYKDYYTNKIDNSIGQTVSVKRREVDDNRDRTCSYGLHFCAMDYLGSYYGSRGRVVIVKINPRDVVSIPSDYNNTKGRCCNYEVVAEHDCTEKEKKEFFNQSVYCDDLYTIEESEYDYDPDADEWWEGYEEESEDYKRGYDEGYNA